MYEKSIIYCRFNSRFFGSDNDGFVPSPHSPRLQGLCTCLGAVNRATESLEPHHICAYLFELAQEFNRYYEKNQVVGSDKEAHRVGIVAVYADILKAGLTILGIAAPERL